MSPMKSSWADLRGIILSHRKPLALGFLLAINRLSGLVLPYSTRFLIDDGWFKLVGGRCQ
jgi:hypothetical protein